MFEVGNKVRLKISPTSLGVVVDIDLSLFLSPIAMRDVKVKWENGAEGWHCKDVLTLMSKEDNDV